jgi:hypothetical protein
MIEESFVVSEGGQTMLLDRWMPVYRMRYGKTTKYLKEHSFFGLIKWYSLIKEETVWDDYYFDYDTETGDIVQKVKIQSIH